MYYKEFHQLSLSALGLGSLRLPTVAGNPNEINRKEGQKILDYALQNGINYIDTAYTYHEGDSERFLGETLKNYPRDSYYLATKFYVSANPDIHSVFEEQLRRCHTDYFDFYLFHGMDENCIDAITDEQKGYLDYLLRQKEAGRIRFLGFSSHAAPDTLTRFLNWYDGFDMALIQLNYLDWTLLNAKKQYEILTQHKIPVWVMEPLKGGRLSTLNSAASKILKSSAPNRSISSWGFRFLMGLPNVQTVLSGMSSLEQLRDNLQTFSHPDPLNSSEKEALTKAGEIFMKDLGVPCSGCRYCCNVCPAKLDIPLLIKGYNERQISGETWRIAQLTQLEHSPRECQQCGLCRQHCPQKIDVPAIMRKLI